MMLLGFTAEVTLSRTTGYYQTVGNLNTFTCDRSILSQLIRQVGRPFGFQCTEDACGCFGYWDCLLLLLSGECVPDTFGCDSERGASDGCICDRRPFVA